jgi:hypothetical protein
VNPTKYAAAAEEIFTQMFMIKKILILIPFVLFAACGRAPVVVDRSYLFDLHIGVMEDELNLFETGGVLYSKKVYHTMRDGFFYISNPAGGKVMKFSSHGDILSLIYNEEKNPPFMQSNDSRRITKWNFHEPGSLAVNADGYLFVVDRASASEEFAVDSNNVSYDYVVLIFDERGNYINYLGRDGINGQNFPLVQSIQMTMRDDVVVIARVLENWQAYWFDKEGAVRYAVSLLSASSLPAGESENLFIENIVADRRQPLLYVRVGSASASSDKGNDYIYIYNAEENRFTGRIEAPADDKSFYELIGSDKEGRLYFLTAFGQDSFYQLKVISSNDGSELFNFTLNTELALQSTFRSLSLSEEGILSALFGNARGADVLWWRIDQMTNNHSVTLNVPENMEEGGESGDNNIESSTPQEVSE